MRSLESANWFGTSANYSTATPCRNQKKEPFSLNNHEIHYKCSCFWRRITRSYDTEVFFRESDRRQHLTWKSEGRY